MKICIESIPVYWSPTETQFVAVMEMFLLRWNESIIIIWKCDRNHPQSFRHPVKSHFNANHRTKKYQDYLCDITTTALSAIDESHWTWFWPMELLHTLRLQLEKTAGVNAGYFTEDKSALLRNYFVFGLQQSLPLCHAFSSASCCQ